MKEYEEMYVVTSSIYGTWPFTDSDDAWRFLEQAIRLPTKTPTAWHIDMIPVCVRPHHDYQHALLSRVNSDIDDLIEAIKEIDGSNYEEEMRELFRRAATK